MRAVVTGRPLVATQHRVEVPRCAERKRFACGRFLSKLELHTVVELKGMAPGAGANLRSLGFLVAGGSVAFVRTNRQA
jgi:hypothetical protein